MSEKREMNLRGYRLEVSQDDDGWAVVVPDLPGCVAGADTLDEAVALIEDAIDAWIEAANTDGRAVPTPRGVDPEYSGRFVLRVPKSLHRRLATEARLDGVSLNTFCVNALSGAVGSQFGSGVQVDSGVVQQGTYASTASTTTYYGGETTGSFLVLGGVGYGAPLKRSIASGSKEFGNPRVLIVTAQGEARPEKAIVITGQSPSTYALAKYAEQRG